MNEQKGNEYAKKGLFEGIQEEVGAESAPFLQFIIRRAGAIAACAAAVLLVLAAMGLWKWHSESKAREAREQLARISMEMSGPEREKALADLAASAPENSRQHIYMRLGQSAARDGNFSSAEKAFAQAASLNPESALGLAAAAGQASALLNQGKHSDAIAVLQALEKRLPAGESAAPIKEMTAEAAAAAGDNDLAAENYEWLAKTLQTPDAAYFRSRAAALREKKSNNQDNSDSAKN